MQSINQLQLHYHAYLQVQFTYCMVSAMKDIIGFVLWTIIL